MSERLSERMVEICRYLENRFGNGSTVSSQLTGFGFKALPEKGYSTNIQLSLVGEAVSGFHKSKVLQIGESPITRFVSFNPERTKVEIEVEVAEKVAEKQGEYIENPGQDTEKVTEKSDEYTEKYTEKQTEKGSEYTENSAESAGNLTETEERIVAILRQNKFATQGGISDKLGITRTYITKIMGGLQARNIIRRVGPDKGGYWEVVMR